MRAALLGCLLLCVQCLHGAPGSEYDFTFAVFKYSGGGDWYEGSVGAQNLMHFLDENTTLHPNPFPQVVAADDAALFLYPFLYATGHGDMVLSDSEASYLRRYLLSGGFWYINDDYGLDSYVRQAVAAVFPDKKMVELPVSHPLFHIYYDFPEGAPKVHEHDGGRPQVFAVYHDDRVAILYTYECDIGDGWAPYQVHKDPEAIRTAALRFGVNIIIFSLSQ